MTLETPPGAGPLSLLWGFEGIAQRDQKAPRIKGAKGRPGNGCKETLGRNGKRIERVGKGRPVFPNPRNSRNREECSQHGGVSVPLGSRRRRKLLTT